MFVPVKVILPATVGVMVNVCGAAEALKVRTVGTRPVLPVPLGVMVIVQVYGLFGVKVKLVEATLTLPEVGPVNV